MQTEHVSHLTRYGLVYLATPYSKYELGIEAAFKDACKLTADLQKVGLYVFSPIAHSHPIAVHGGLDPLDYRIWAPWNEKFMLSSSCLLVGKLAGWSQSVGVWAEIDFFRKRLQPVWFLDPRTLLVERQEPVFCV